MNLYAYVGDDPVNGVDPYGTQSNVFELVVTGLSVAFLGAGGAGVTLGSTNAGSSPSYAPLPPPQAQSEVTIHARAKRKKQRPQNNGSQCAAGRYTQAGVGAGGTVAFIIPGLGVAAQTRVSFPPGNELRGFQFYGSLQGNAMLGLGAYLGAGVTAGGGHSHGLLPTGISGSGSLFGEGDIGAGPSLSASHQFNSGGSSTSAGIPFLPAKLGLGVGAYVGGGWAYNITLATPPFGCHP